jgi:glycosyltransferase involved in cell wall biosynthesis
MCGIAAQANNNIIMTNFSLPKITIIIGVLNMQRFLGMALDSVVRQNYPNLELIVMDGGSTDGTLNVIKQYAHLITYWTSGKDKGHSDACNKALEIATGDYIGLLNADDILGEGLLHDIAAVYSKNPAAQVITCGVRIIEGEQITQEIADPQKLQLTLRNMLFELPLINARFFHKNIFTLYGKFQATHADGSYNLSNDRDFLIRLTLAGVQSEIITKPLYFYLSHQESLTFGNKNRIKSRREHLQLAEKFLHLPTLQLEQKDIFHSWQINESVYLCLIYLLDAKVKNAFAVMKYGYTLGGYEWMQKFLAVIVCGVFRKLLPKSINNG